MFCITSPQRKRQRRGIALAEEFRAAFRKVRPNAQTRVRTLGNLIAKNRGTSAHIREKNSHLAEQDKSFKLPADANFMLANLIHNTLLFLPRRKLIEIIRRHIALRKINDEPHFCRIWDVVSREPVSNIMRHGIDRRRHIMHGIIIRGHPFLQRHVRPFEFAIIIPPLL
jgi:hypothetical protein